jgi:hypothetical protein
MLLDVIVGEGKLILINGGGVLVLVVFVKLAGFFGPWVRGFFCWIWFMRADL